MNKITEALSRLRALADGPKGGRADYVGTISSDDAHLLSVQLSQLLKLKQCVDDALPALHWVTGHLRYEAENCRRHADFSPIASTFDDAASELNAVVLANIGADFTASVTPQSETEPTPNVIYAPNVVTCRCGAIIHDNDGHFCALPTQGTE